MKIFVLVAAVCLAVSSNAQFRLGVKTGMNISNLRNDDLRDSDPLISGHIGAIADLPLGKSPFNLQAEVVYQQLGYKNSNIYATAASGSFLDVVKSHRISYIKVPMHIMYRMAADNAVFKAGLGPFFAFKTSDKLKVGGGDEYTDEAVLPVFVEKIRPVLTGMSIQLNAEWKTFFASMWLQPGFNGLYIDNSASPGQKWSYTSAGISLGFLFNVKAGRR